MKVFITGRKGLVGRWFWRALHEQHTVYGVDIKDGCDVVPLLQSHMVDAQWDLVIHCAANVGGRANIDRHPLNVALNAGIDATLFDWALRTNQKKVVYFSSSAAYPTALQQRDANRPLDESDIDLDAIQTPDAMYGMAKLYGEVMAKHAQAQGLDVLVLRPFSGYAEDQDLDYPFPSLIERAARRASPFEVWGDGTQTRDWIHMSDVVEAVMAAVREGASGPINLGSGVGTSFKDLAEMACQSTRHKPEFKFLPDKPTGVHTRVSRNTRMLELHTPAVSLEEGVHRALHASVAQRIEQPVSTR